MAVVKRRPLSTKEIAAKSGLSIATIKSLSRAESWMGYEVSTVIRFTSACGVDLTHQKYARQKLMRMLNSINGPPHLRTAERRYWSSVLTGERRWRASSKP